MSRFGMSESIFDCFFVCVHMTVWCALEGPVPFCVQPSPHVLVRPLAD